jgi:LacI family transcriptional regulator
MKITIKEVAQEANVSIATVSRVLNGKDKVKKTTRLKIQEAVKKLNFQPNHIARAMIIKKTKTIGLLVPQLSNEYWALLSEIIQEKLWLKGYPLILCSTDRDLDKEKIFTKMFIERMVDGIIYCSTASKYGDQKERTHLELIKRHSIAMVSFTPDMDDVNCILGDHLQGAINAVQHLIDLGHKKIAHIGGPAVSRDREFGYRNAIVINGLQVDESLIIRENEETYQYGYKSVKKLLANKADFTAVFCGNDIIAIGAIKALEEASINVPKDVAVVGYDDINMASLCKPALTTVQQPIREMVDAAVDLLIESMEKNNKKQVPKKVVFQAKLIIRESCGTYLT